MKLDYMQRLTLGIMALQKDFPPGVTVTSIEHDAKCGVFKDNACSCVPDINLTVNGTKFEIDEEGVLHERSD